MKNLMYILLCLLFSISVTAADLTGVKIYVNPGHGGYNGGNDRNEATIPFALEDTLGFWESSSNLRKGLALRDMLKASNATVIISRTINREEDDRNLTEIAEEANANNVDAFLSIHSNAAGGVNASTNYLLLLYRGIDNQPTVPASVPMTQAAWARLITNQTTVWSHYSAASPNLRGDVSYYPPERDGLGVLRPLTVPGFLSEGSFHDYKPEAHRLLNPDYCKLEAVNFYRYFCDYFNAEIPAKGIITGWVKGKEERISNPLFLFRTNTDDQWLPLNGAVVKLKDNAGTELATYTVDQFYNGVFAFYDLAPGTYKLEFSAADHNSGTATVQVEAGKTAYVKQLLVNPSLPDYKPILPDYPDPTQEAGVLPLDHYTFGDAAPQLPDWLNANQIRKILYRNDKYYVLTEDPKILVISATDYTLIREMDLTGISGGIKTISDINFTADGYLLACNKNEIAFTETQGRYFKVYTWDDDDAVPSLLFQTQLQGNWNNGVMGETFAVSGPRWKCYLYVPSTTTGSSKATRVVGYLREEGFNLGYKYMGGTASYLPATWGEKIKFMISPAGKESFILDSEVALPTEYKFNWDAANGAVLENVKTFAEVNGNNPVAIASGNFIFRHAKHTFMAAPVCNADATAVGVALFNITNGIDKAVKVSDKLPAAGLGAQAATYMMSAAKVRGYDLDLMIIAQNQGAARYSTQTPATTANIYASELKVNTVSGTSLEFTLNENATSVIITINDENGEVKSIDAGPLNKGHNSVSADLSDLSQGTYTWSVTAMAGVVDRPVKISNNSRPEMQFFSARGVAVDNEFDSPFFGRVYAVESAPGQVTNRSTDDGVYILNAALEDVTAQGAKSYDGGVVWGAGSSPFRLCVAPDGKVYMNDWSDTHSGVWVMDPANPSAPFTEVFAGLTRAGSGLASIGGVNVHGSIAHCWVTGKGEDTKLFTFDEDYIDAVATKPGNVLQYNIGTLQSPWQQAPSAIVYDNAKNGNIQLNFNSCIAPDTRGGWWISQHRATDAAGIPSLIHVNAAGTVDFNSGSTPTLIENSVWGGMAVSYDGTRLAMGCNDEIKIFDVTFSDEGIPSLTRIHSIKPALGNSCGLAFDRAGNVYLISNTTERLGVWALPKTDNQFITPAPETQKIVVLPTGTADPKNKENNVTVYPNPAKDHIRIALPDDQSATVQVDIIDMTGRVVLKEYVQTGESLTVSQLPKGNYIVAVHHEGKVFRSKLIIK